MCIFDLSDFYALPDPTPKGFMSPPGTNEDQTKDFSPLLLVRQ